jgi:hypothetical protein
MNRISTLLTTHALQRCTQRGVSRRALQLALTQSDREIEVGGGVTALSLSADHLRAVPKCDWDTDTIRRASQLAVLVNEQGEIITVLRQKPGAKGRRYRGRV